MGTLGTVAPIVSAITQVVSAIVQGVQMHHLNKLAGEIEVTTRGILNEALNLRKDLWTQYNDGMDLLFHKLDDMWNEIRNVVGVLGMIGDLLASGVKGGTLATDSGGVSFREMFAALIKSRPVPKKYMPHSPT